MIDEISNGEFILIKCKNKLKSRSGDLLLNLRNTSVRLDCLLVVFD